MDEAVKLSDEGRIVEEAWFALPRHYPSLALDAFVIMPNHVHGILVLRDVGAGFKPAPTAAARRSLRRHAIPEIVRAFKTFSARQINVRQQAVGRHVWQRGYYDHVVRDDRDLGRIRDYIFANPLRWSMDRENPLRTESDPFDSWLSGQVRPVPSMRS
jgi:REP element-mobilizing transposase RayT